MRIYVCAPTVYSFAQIGDIPPAVALDVLVHRFRAHFPCVGYARNITDVDNKIIMAGAVGGANCDTIAARVEVTLWKRDPRNFVLWKPLKPGKPGWDSPWGFGSTCWRIG